MTSQTRGKSSTDVGLLGFDTEGRRPLRRVEAKVGEKPVPPKEVQEPPPDFFDENGNSSHGGGGNGNSNSNANQPG